MMNQATLQAVVVPATVMKEDKATQQISLFNEDGTPFTGSGGGGGDSGDALTPENNLSDVSSRQTSLNNLAGAVTSGRVLRGDGTNVSLSALEAGDIPTLNQDTTGHAANLGSGATFPAYTAPKVTALTFSTTLNIDASLGNVFTVTLTASTATIENPTNPHDAQVIHLRIKQDATGSRTVAWGTAYNWGTSAGNANDAPTLTTTASKTDLLGFEYDADLSKWVYLGAPFPQGF